MERRETNRFTLASRSMAKTAQPCLSRVLQTHLELPAVRGIRRARKRCYDAIRDGDSDLIVTRKKMEKLSPEAIEAQLQEIFRGAPPLDCQSVLDDVRE